MNYQKSERQQTSGHNQAPTADRLSERKDESKSPHIANGTNGRRLSKDDVGASHRANDWGSSNNHVDDHGHRPAEDWFESHMAQKVRVNEPQWGYSRRPNWNQWVAPHVQNSPQTSPQSPNDGHIGNNLYTRGMYGSQVGDVCLHSSIR